MPPKDYDITRTGLQDWRTIKAQNDGQFDEEYLQRRKQARRYRESIKNSVGDFGKTAAQNPEMFSTGSPIQANPEYGKSRYDAPDATLDQYLNTQDYRGTYQSGLEQIANGVLKGAITTGTTYIDLLAGIPVGIVTAVAEGRLSGIWDNVITNAMQAVTDWSEEALPNYYTREQQESAWYSPVNLFSANFLGDKLIKNFGFSAGAGLGMKTISKIPKLLPKLVKNQNVAKAIHSAETAFAGAVGEGSIEALNGTREWANQNRNLIEQERSQNLAALDLKYSQLEQSIKEQYGDTEMYQQLVAGLVSDYQKEANQINNLANRKVAELQNHIDDQGNLILAGNIPILWGSNILTLGKMIARGYNVTENSLGKYVRKAATSEGGKMAYESTLTSARQALRYAKTPFLEGLEEMNQAVVSTAAKNRAQDYYNMSVDPDATEATKSYMGYIWDALGQTYGDINNYEEFVIGMLSSGISDIVVGQGKALRDERRQVNDAVTRANDAINNFNNRTLLQNMNRQQVLEDQKLDAALRNDKKEFKDSEFGQIASAVIAFSQIGKIEDLKAMLDTNLGNMTDEELETLADQLSQKDDTGAETNSFTLMTNQQRRDYLAKQKAAYEKTIDDYDKIRAELIEQTGSLFSPEQQAELIFYKLRANNANDRIGELDNDINDKILNGTSWTPQILKKLGLDEDIVYTKQEVADAVKNFNGTNKQLAALFKGQSIEQLFLDKDRLEADIKKYNDTVLDFIVNPQKLEKKNSKIRNKINNIFTNRKVQNIIPRFNGINTFSEFTRTLQNVDPKLQKAVLDELIKQGNTEAKSFADKTTYAKYVASTLESIDADDYIRDRAAQLILEAIDKQTLNATKDLDNPLYSRDNNADLSDNEYNELYNVLANTLGKANEEINNVITEEAPIKPEPQPEEVSDEDFFAQAIANLDAAQQAQQPEEPEAPKAEDGKLVDFTEVTPNSIEPENTTVLDTPAKGTNDGNLHDTEPTEDNRNLGQKPVSSTNPLEELARMGLGIKEVDVKEDSKNYGKPLTEQTDAEGNKTQLAKDLTPVYNRLRELNAFENLNNGAVKVGSVITFALDTTMKGEHTVDGETVIYDEPAVLLYVGDKCVGSLSKSDANNIGILAKLKEEFKGKTSSNPMLSQRYYTTVETMEHGMVKFTNSWRKLTESDLDAIKERMSNATTSKDEVVPIIAVYNANEGAFVRTNTSEKFYIGKQIGPSFYGGFYNGRAALLIPTVAYNNQSDAQPKKSFIPVGLNRIRAKELDPHSATYVELHNLFRQIFEADCTAEKLNKIVGNIRKLITYNYHLSAEEAQEVFIDAAFPKTDGNDNVVYNNGQVVLTPIANHSWFAKNKVDPAQGRFTHLRIKWKRADGQVMTASIQTHTGNVKATQSFDNDFINQQTDALMRMFLEDLNAYVNINKNRLIDPTYIQQLLDEGVLQTNAEDLRVIGNNFTMTPKVFEHENNQPNSTEESNNPKLFDDDGNLNEAAYDVPGFTDDDFGRLRRESQRTTSEIIDINKEVDRIMKMLPQLDRDKVFKVVNDLIKVNDKGILAMGQFDKGIITLSQIAESGTAYHEAFHLVFNMLLSREEKTALLNEYKSKYTKDTPLQLEERMAEDFRDFMMTRESRSLSQKMLDFFKDLLNLILYKTTHKMTFDTISSRIWRGKYANTELNSTEQLRNRNVTANPKDYVLNVIQQEFEKFQSKDGYALGTYTVTREDVNGKTIEFDRPKYIKQLIVQENGKYFVNMGIAYDKYGEESPTDKLTNKLRYTNAKPIDIFNTLVNRLGLDDVLHVIELETSYEDLQGNPIYRYQIILDNATIDNITEMESNNPAGLPLEVLKDIQNGNYTKTAEELYQGQSDPFNKKDICGYK